MQQLYFISGLPRSGSTLLDAILRHNRKFHDAMLALTAVCPVMNRLLSSLLKKGLFG
jgi:hypothetical protein